jgi:hypothetical protein
MTNSKIKNAQKTIKGRSSIIWSMISEEWPHEMIQAQIRLLNKWIEMHPELKIEPELF